jgi:hypothetical protein
MNSKKVKELQQVYVNMMISEDIYDTEFIQGFKHCLRQCLSTKQLIQAENMLVKNNNLRFYLKLENFKECLSTEEFKQLFSAGDFNYNLETIDYLKDNLKFYIDDEKRVSSLLTLLDIALEAYMDK